MCNIILLLVVNNIYICGLWSINLLNSQNNKIREYENTSYEYSISYYSGSWKLEVNIYSGDSILNNNTSTLYPTIVEALKCTRYANSNNPRFLSFHAHSLERAGRAGRWVHYRTVRLRSERS